MLQFVLPNLTVSELDDLEGLHPNGTLHFPFRHDNWEDFIRHMDEGLQRKYSECYKENPKFGLVWMGKCRIYELVLNERIILIRIFWLPRCYTIS